MNRFRLCVRLALCLSACRPSDAGPAPEASLQPVVPQASGAIPVGPSGVDPDEVEPSGPTGPSLPPDPPPPVPRACAENAQDPAAPAAYRAPYLQDVSSTRAVVRWASPPGNTAFVRFASDGHLTERADALTAFLPKALTKLAVDEAQHTAELTNLQPNTRYCYQVFERTDTGVEFAASAGTTFLTAPTIATPFAALVLGDSGNGSAAQTRVRNQMLQRSFDLILHTGDIAYDYGTFEEFEKQVFDVYKDLFARIPFFPSPGNHEYWTAGAGPYFNLFDLPKNSDRFFDRERYYSFDWGNTHFVALDSNVPLAQIGDQEAGKDMAEWLAADLAASNAEWKVVYFHHPPYSSGPHGSNSVVRDKLVPVFQNGGVHLVLNGHDHQYERTKPLTNHVPATNGISYIVTGGGGASLYSRVSTNAFTEVYAKKHNFGLLRADGCRMVYTAIDDRGVQLDQLELSHCP